MQGWLKKKSPKTQGKKVMDVWQKRYFVLSGGELKYYKNEKLAGLSNSEPLKSIALSHVLCATVNPKHNDMFVIDLGLERKVKLQANSEPERDAWVAAIEEAKLKAWSAQEEHALQITVDEVKKARMPSSEQTSSPAQKAGSFASPASGIRDQEELLQGNPTRKQQCCVIS
ncbi:hypothetical protein AB1Y20_006145 [Prymnesium parvum]|uniref:PH domain-containing protein n=1 Tax=Prymnesium parvum TaxID=97485 RepID=A0AB34J552_PRYPA|mmetsp:Transcript_30076/g.75147  ORF Transcript_30076/g.75147 Transcript_30076/m.75147 type:complete len:171 (+) Transcript_30076:129-641(+)